MKSIEEIEQLASEHILSENGQLGFILGYIQCQKDMAKEIDNLKGQLRTYEAKEPKYAVEGDYCSVWMY